MRRFEPGTGELDALLEAIEHDPEHTHLTIPMSPQIIRWMLRGTFTSEDGHVARMSGGTIRGNEFVPFFTKLEIVR